MQKGKLRKHQVHYSGDFAKQKQQKKNKYLKMQTIPTTPKHPPTQQQPPFQPTASDSKSNNNPLIIIIENVQHKRGELGKGTVKCLGAIAGITLRIRNVCRCFSGDCDYSDNATPQSKAAISWGLFAQMHSGQQPKYQEPRAVPAKLKRTVSKPLSLRAGWCFHFICFPLF